MFILSVLAWAGSCIGLYGMDINKPISGWRIPLRVILRILIQRVCQNLVVRSQCISYRWYLQHFSKQKPKFLGCEKIQQFYLLFF